jgi:hypothetical protein
MTNAPRAHPLTGKVRALRAQNLPLREIGARLGISHELVRRIAGPMPRRVTRGEAMYFPLSREDRQALAASAAELGLTVAIGRYTGGGSIALLLDAIARGEIIASWQSGSPAPETYQIESQRSRVRLEAAPWVWLRLDQRARGFGLRVDGIAQRRQRRIALLIRAIVGGSVGLRWREGAGPDTAPVDYRGGRA